MQSMQPYDFSEWIDLLRVEGWEKNVVPLLEARREWLKEKLVTLSGGEEADQIRGAIREIAVILDMPELAAEEAAEMKHRTEEHGGRRTRWLPRRLSATGEPAER